MTSFIYQPETDLQIKRTNLCCVLVWGVGCVCEREIGGKGIDREFGTDMYTLLYLKQIPTRSSVEHRELCSVLRGSLDGRGVCGRMDTCVHKAEFLCCPPESITTLLTGYTPKQNEKLTKKEDQYLSRGRQGREKREGR